MAIEDRATAAEWNEADLQQLCDENRREAPRLEFKQELHLDTQEHKAEVEHDIQGLANAGGGHLIYGIEEATLADGSPVAGALRPLSDGSLPEQLNNVF
jgi:predicted HTH transcriptional regulator